jgi:type I restriction-modification system DNA methylase subunit
MNQQALSAFIWSVADLLRGDYKQSEYGRVILPFTVLRRLDCVLETTKPAVLSEHKARKGQKGAEAFLLKAAKQSFYNTAKLDLKKLTGAPDDIKPNLYAYLKLVYVNDVLRGKLLESDTLVEQAVNNTKEQFAASPDLAKELVNAIMDALSAHTTMSQQALDSERVQQGLRDILLDQAGLYEALRQRGASDSSKETS